MTATATTLACEDCLRRTALVAGLSGTLDIEWRRRAATARVLALPDAELLALAPPTARAEYASFAAQGAREAAGRAGLALICRCDDAYPARLRALPDPPAVLHVLGDPEALAEPDAVAVVGARRATPYGLDVARVLGRGLATAGVPVVSGMALGVDAAAHHGALEGASAPVAVLAAAAETPYPARHRSLHAALAARGCVVSELPPGSRAFRWAFVARNRIVAALSEVTVIVEATERSGSLTTADFAADLGRAVAAVPGRVTNRTAAGTNGLLQSGAALVRHAADVLEVLADCTGHRHAIPVAAGTATAATGGASASASATVTGGGPAPALSPALLELLAAVEDGRGTLGELAAGDADARAVLAGLGELELRGLVRRDFGGRYRPAAYP